MVVGIGPSLDFCLFGFLRYFFVCFDRVSLYSPNSLELDMYNRLASKSQRSTFFCLLNAGSKGMCHHAQLPTLFLIRSQVFY